MKKVIQGVITFIILSAIAISICSIYNNVQGFLVAILFILIFWTTIEFVNFLNKKD
jgi:purine-cytosine permease-like protein